MITLLLITLVKPTIFLTDLISELVQLIPVTPQLKEEEPRLPPQMQPTLQTSILVQPQQTPLQAHQQVLLQDHQEAQDHQHQQLVPETTSHGVDIFSKFKTSMP